MGNVVPKPNFGICTDRYMGIFLSETHVNRLSDFFFSYFLVPIEMNRGQHVINKLKGNSLPQKDRIKKWKIVTGDLVEMRYGEDKGKQGQVVKVLRKKNRLVVKGVNIVCVIYPITPTNKFRQNDM